MRLKHLARSALAFSVISSAGVFAAPPATPPIEAAADRPVLDVVFVLDTTSSMGGLLEGAKQKIWSIASRMAAGKPTPRVRVGLVAYRDQGDAYVTRVYGLSEDLDGVYKNLQAFQPEGGGDTPEAVQDGLLDAVDKMQWSAAPHAAKMIFLVGDAPAHDQDLPKLRAASKKAISRGIVVNAIRCGDDATAGLQFQEVARLADGRFDSISQSGGVVATVTPYDGDLAKLNGALMDTAVYAGKAEAQARGEERRTETKAMAAPAAADRMSFAAKAGPAKSLSGAASVGAVDLAEAPEQAATMKDDELPASMRALDKGQRVAFAKEQQAHRAKLQEEISTIAKKRDEFLATKARESKDSFDSRVFESVKTSAAKAGVAY